MSLEYIEGKFGLWEEVSNPMDTEENVNVVEQSHKENVMPKSSFLNRKVLIIIACFLFVVIGIGGFKIYDYLTSFHPYQKQEYNSEKKKMGNVYILKRYFPATEIKTGDLFYDDEKELYIEVHNKSTKPIKFAGSDIEIKLLEKDTIKKIKGISEDIIEPGYKLTMKSDIYVPALTTQEIDDLRNKILQGYKLINESERLSEETRSKLYLVPLDERRRALESMNENYAARIRLINAMEEAKKRLTIMEDSLEKEKGRTPLKEFIEYISYRPKENPEKGAIIKF